ncbi:MAG TPA: 6-carboxytetrahydropterin synthase [Bacteroidales bacterium]|nr:6-carboxytetrahydropterin synthase [Bacteroidales bacterium]
MKKFVPFVKIYEMDTIIRVTKEFSFEMAHALWNYDGPCKNIHGHSYRLFVTVKGIALNNPGHPKHGMLIDFGELKKIVNREIVNQLDHALVVHKDAPHQMLNNIDQMFEKYFVFDFQPTCENMVVDIANKIKKQLPGHVTLHSVRLYETATSYAEWFAEDNN